MTSLLVTLASVQFTHIVDFMILMPLGPQLMRDLNINAEQFSLLVSSYTFAAGFSGLIGSFFVDRWDRKSALVVMYAGFIVGTLACGMAQTYSVLLTARFLAGGFGGLLGPVVLAIVGDAVPAERRGRALGLVMMSFSVASIFGVPFSLYLATVWDWHAPFYFVVASGILVLAGITVFVPKMTGHMKLHVRHSFRKVAFEGGRWTGIVLMAILVLSQFTLIPFMSPYLVFNVGFPETSLPLLYLFGGLISIVTSPLWGKLSDRFGPPVILVLALIASTVPFMLLTHLPQVSTITVLAVTTLMFACMGGRMVSAMTLVQSQVDPSMRGAYMGLISSMQQFASAAAAFFAGRIVYKSADGILHNYNVTGLIATALTILAVFVVLWSNPIRRSKRL